VQSVIVKHYITEDTATYPSKIVTKQQGGQQHCARNISWRWSSVWPKHVGWHNRRRHSNVLKTDCVLVCILKHSAWVGVLNNVKHTLCHLLQPLNFELVARFLENTWIPGLNCLLFGRSTEGTPNFVGFYYSSALTLRRLMSYIYGAPILDVSRSHTTTQHSR